VCFYCVRFNFFSSMPRDWLGFWPILCRVERKTLSRSIMMMGRASLSQMVTKYQFTQQQPFYGPLSGTTWVSWYQKKHSPTHHPDHHPIFISFFHLARSIASSLFKLHAWQSFCTTSFHVLFGLPFGLEPSTSYSIHFFTQSVSSFQIPIKIILMIDHNWPFSYLRVVLTKL